MDPLSMPLQLSASSSAKSGADGAFSGAMQSYGAGAWSINLGGSGVANFSANASTAATPTTAAALAPVAGIPTWALVVAAAVLVWALK